MGIYWCALDKGRKEKFEAPENFSIKAPGIFHPLSPFPGMFIMMNSFGYCFELINDCDEDTYYDSEVKDITQEVYRKYLEYYPKIKNDS